MKACFIHGGETVIARGQGLPDVEINRKTWPKLIDIVRKRTGLEIPVWQCLLVYYNVCLYSLMEPNIIYLWNKYNTIHGLANETSESYDGVSAVYADACTVIETEMNRIENERKNKEHLSGLK